MSAGRSPPPTATATSSTRSGSARDPLAHRPHEHASETKLAAATTAGTASEADGGSRSSTQTPEQAREVRRDEKRRIFEKVEQEFGIEQVDPAWSRDAERSLQQAIAALPASLGTIDSIASKSEHSRIAMTFDDAKQYNQFFEALFVPDVRPRDPGAPLARAAFSDHGGIFVPHKELGDDNKFHAVIFVARRHSPAG